MEKLIRLAQIFECTLDELVLGDLTARPVEQGTPTAHDPQDICGYDQVMRAFAVRLASGSAPSWAASAWPSCSRRSQDPW